MIIDISPDHIILENVRVNRPARISPSQWMQFWETKTNDPGYSAGHKDGFSAGYEAGRKDERMMADE